MESPFPSFVKMILPSTVGENKLKLPLTFARKYRGRLGDVAELTTPNGKVREVDVHKGKKNVWFRRGWSQFVEEHSIGCGSSLLFEYKNSSKFDVRIFGISECEMEYPCGGPHAKRQAEVPRKRPAHAKAEFEVPAKRKRPAFECKIEIDDDDDTAVLGCNPFPSRREAPSGYKGWSARNVVRGDEPATGQKGFKRCKVSGDKKHGNNSRRGRLNLDKHFDEDDITTRQKVGKNIIVPWKYSSTMRGMQPETRRAFDKAGTRNPKNPAFVVILSSHYINNNSVHVPVDFARRYIDERSEFIRVQANVKGNDKEWHLKISCKGRRVNSFTTGWLEFVDDNDLELGDVCLFERISSKPIVLKASLFRALSFR